LKDSIVATENIVELSKQVKALELEAEKAQVERSNINNLLQRAAEQAAVKANKQRRDELTTEIENLKLEKAAIDCQFPNGLPEKAVLSDAFSKADTLKSFESEYKMLEGDGVDAAELERLESLFKGRFVEESSLDMMRSKAAQLSSLNARCEAKQELISSAEAEGAPKRRSAMPFLLICASAFAVAGCVMLFSSVTVASPFFKMVSRYKSSSPVMVKGI
jgi:hypothetical protein